ncbi:YqgE/AlgH family protein, partial [Chitinophaga sp.]|uniref:YqgE/AlgH family protein n=1 Tax=Chitinophaga sp. TaxID=1869181 RepID=UPI002CD94C69
MVTLSPGILLIADPFLKDPNFARTVVLLCEYQEKGSFGFVINKLFDQTLSDLVPEVLISNIPVYYGGPVQMD